jgi:hypothetical protein
MVPTPSHRWLTPSGLNERKSDSKPVARDNDTTVSETVVGNNQCLCQGFDVKSRPRFLVTSVKKSVALFSGFVPRFRAGRNRHCRSGGGVVGIMSCETVISFYGDPSRYARQAGEWSPDAQGLALHGCQEYNR